MSKLTVGLPVFNAMPFLPETVESLLTQTYDNFDVLVIDDGSTDGSIEYLESLHNTRFRIVKQPNRGLSATLNRMLRDTSLPWLVRQDADDIAYPNRLKVIAEAIERFPDAGMFYSLADQFPWAPGREKFRTTVAGPETLRAVTRAGYLLGVAHPTVVLNVAKTLALGGYRTDLRAAEDIELWSRMALYHDIQLIPEVTLAVRLTVSRIQGSGLFEQTLEMMFAQYLLLSKLWNLPPQPLEAIRSSLAGLVNRGELSCRIKLRHAAIEFDHQRMYGAIKHALAAAWLAPGYLLTRISRRIARRIRVAAQEKRIEVSGINPIHFMRKCKELWPHNCHPTQT